MDNKILLNSQTLEQYLLMPTLGFIVKMCERERDCFFFFNFLGKTLDYEINIA